MTLTIIFEICFRASAKQNGEVMGVGRERFQLDNLTTVLHCNLTEYWLHQTKGSETRYLSWINKAVGEKHFWKRLSYLLSQVSRAPRRND